MISLSFLTLFFGGALMLFFYFVANKKKNYPPGPLRIPIIGNLAAFGSDPYVLFSTLAKKYGKIYSLKIGSMDCVVINDGKMIRDAFNESAFSGRPEMKPFEIFSNGINGLTVTEGKVWEEQRRFTLRHLRDFGFGKNSMENLIIDEVKEVIELLKKEEGKPIVLNNRFSLAVINSLWNIITGTRFKQDDPKLVNFLRDANDSFAESTKNGFAVFMPWVVDWFPEWSGFNKMKKMAQTWLIHFENSVDEHKKNLSPENEPTDFIDSYLKEIEQTKDPNSSFYKEQGRTSLVAVIADLFGAGSETTSQTLNWLILYLLTHQKYQKKFHEEIDRVIGKNKLPSLADKSNMPYTEAIIAETLRISTLAPLGVFHAAMKDVNFQGYEIPKGTTIISYLKSVHYDENVWKEPSKFDPERHLTQDGNFVKNENIMAFSTGKRVCPGESLSRDEIFLFATSVFQRFNILIDPENPNPSLEPEIGMFSIPRKFKCILKDRIEN